MKLDLGLSENEEMLKKTALDFMRRDATKEVVQNLQDTDTGCTTELWQKMAGLGWAGIIIPEEYGGTGSTLTSAGVLLEVLGTGPLPGPLFSASILGSSIIMEAGTEEQKRQVLPAIANGSQVVTLAMTEPDFSWEPGAIQTKVSHSNDGFTLDGVKLFAYDAGAATHLIVAASTGDGIGLFLVDRKSEGLSVTRLPGYLAGQTFEVKMDSVRVPQAALLGENANNLQALESAITRSIPVLCAYKVGGCQALVDMTILYSRTRVQFGQLIGRFQRVQDMIIEMVNQLDAARWTTYECLWKLDADRPAAESVHMAKAVTSAAYWEASTLAHRVFSGISYAKDHPASFHTRASRSLYHYLGDPAYHRQRLAKLLTGV
ncbi:MAG: acyl-CoA dehydrogenase family protein [Dehalococcoidales bacterium]|nr:MAG: acyl-CoA dehydrogenase family protein [Dehalococcoidales bacterium]